MRKGILMVRYVERWDKSICSYSIYDLRKQKFLSYTDEVLDMLNEYENKVYKHWIVRFVLWLKRMQI